MVFLKIIYKILFIEIKQFLLYKITGSHNPDVCFLEIYR
ncbi:hypothetical protein D3OALGA1CA_1438 [Olavius algarvensis associated proteobacterium Delta 3]|nr:hypothetical protein D3OALGB2SA_886 [Olavius algarvensis associated proteobacterium Delta 3]CAB5101190.1 hypothetical protein D3OALGA1CA_1438 [Olavius algarvensis associated proteobacterium Delta 3]